MTKNKTPHLPDDLEQELNDYFTSPEPQPEFVARLERGLHSKFSEKEKTKMVGKSTKFKWGLGFAIAAVLIGLLVTSPTVAAAMKRLLSYIPGVGLVDSGSPFRVLVEPVTQTRDGVTVAVKEMVLGTEKTIIVFSMEGIPFDALSRYENEPGCNGSAEVHLPDGSVLRQMGGSATGWGTGMEMRFMYESIPADVNEATLFMPCVQGTLPGTLPENWELPLRFIPAPSDMTLMPVIEVTPSQDAGTASANPLVLEKVVETETGYILIGRFVSAGLNTDANVLGISEFPKITDANGQEIQYTTPNDLDITTTEMGVFPWAYELEAKQFAWPLTITLKAVDGEAPGSQTAFDFDTGPNPKAGQEWVLDKQLQLGEYAVTLTSITFNGDGYTFKFKSSEEVNINISVEIAGSSPVGGGGGGDGEGNSESSMVYEGTPPTGKLSLVFYSTPIIQIPGPWKLEWQPADASSATSPAPTEAPRACLTVDSYQGALSSPYPQTAPTGKVSVYGRILEDGQKPTPENYGVYVVNLDGRDKQIIGQGVWSSLSPDGTQIAYAVSDDGLHIVDLASGEDRRIPNTQNDDNVPRWSPDGKQIAFMRTEDFNLYIMNADGSGVKQVNDGIDYEELIGWSADGASLFYGANTQDGVLLNQLDIASGSIKKLFTIKSSGLEVSLSPDGTRIAFMDQAGNESTYGVYTAALDGSDRKLIAQMGHWLAMRPVWSPDGEWLLMGILNTDNTDSESRAVAVNLQNCLAVPLPISGDVSSWVP